MMTFDETPRGKAMFRILTGWLGLTALLLAWEDMPGLLYLILLAVLILVASFPVFRRSKGDGEECDDG